MPNHRMLPRLALLAMALSAPATDAQCRRAPLTATADPHPTSAAPLAAAISARESELGVEDRPAAPGPETHVAALTAQAMDPSASPARGAVGRADAPPPAEPELGTDAPSATAPATDTKPPTPVALKPDYAVAPGETLRAVLARWAEADGWQLAWDAGNDYALDAAARFPGGDLERAVTQLLEALQRNGAPYGASLAAGNRVIRVTRVR